MSVRTSKIKNGAYLKKFNDSTSALKKIPWIIQTLTLIYVKRVRTSEFLRLR